MNRYPKLVKSVRDVIPRKILISVFYPLIAAGRSAHKKWILPRFKSLLIRAESFYRVLQLRDAGLTATAIGQIDDEWRQRTEDTLACPDNSAIPRCVEAGKVEGSCLIMHNGLKIRALSYYGAGMLNLLRANRGVHEPQEERAFQEILPLMTAGACMVELGSYWGFYSLWFATEVQRARCFLVEPDPRNLEAGKQNFALNRKTAKFICAALGNRFSTQLPLCRVVTLEEICRNNGITHIDLLHADIQGAEYDMLQQSVHLFQNATVGFVFISTHTEHLHSSCRNFLASHHYSVLCDVPPSHSYSVDGLLVAKNQSIDLPKALQVSRKP